MIALKMVEAAEAAAVILLAAYFVEMAYAKVSQWFGFAGVR